MSLAGLWVRKLIEAGQSPSDINLVLAEICHAIEADVGVLFLGPSPRFGPGHTFYCGIEDALLDFYHRHSENDAYLQHYSTHHFQGKMVPLQSMLPLKKIDDDWFREVMLPTLSVKFSISGYSFISKQEVQVLTFHRYSSPFPPNCQVQLQQFMGELIPWSQFYLSTQKLIDQFGSTPLHHGSIQLPKNLTPAERQVIHLLSQGCDGSEITQLRGVSKETTKSQIKSILHKLDCKHQNHLLHKLYTELVI
ncbi:hypothetical protein C9J01_03540 [Photobacterium rosenbergii]|uniref:HTH luxR-type domain-containing protein n=1 Tax=Photobacterium rosenbergii TaxID=294936 RepID=A0A2T3NKR1_9GAMM|nr:helix-turn-helix transcriptional regulator [Photobacterium rosenbergii]PSW16091.1 hypothetical protein C9J01_03540 [Photobacterium rosenbergii]